MPDFSAQIRSGIWSALVTRAAPGVAGGLMGFVLTKLSLTGTDFSALGLDSEIVKNGIVTFLVVLLTSPMTYVDLFCLAVRKVRLFLNAAGKKTEEAFNDPIKDEDKNA